MSNIVEKEFYPLPLNSFKSEQKLPFPIYLRLNNNSFIKYLEKEEIFNIKLYRNLNNNGINYVYALKKDRPAQLKYFEEVLDNVVNDNNLLPEVKANIVNDLAQQVVLEAIERPSPESIKRCELAAVAQVELILADKGALINLLNISKYDYYTYSHSVTVCFLLIGSLNLMEIKTDRVLLVQYGLGALLHDIGKIKISKELLNKPTKFSDEELNEVKKHPHFGYEIVKQQFPEISRQALSVILMHHEDLDGGGYPMGLTEADIPLEIRLVRIIDIFDALTTNRPYKSAISCYDALRLIMKEFNGKVDKKLLHGFIHIVSQKSANIKNY